MPIAGLVKPFGKGKYKIYAGNTAGPSSYPSGGFDVQITGLSKVHAAVVIAGGGYLAEVASISGNTIKVKVNYFDYDAAGDGTAIEVPSGTDLSGVTFYVIAIGE